MSAKAANAETDPGDIVQVVNPGGRSPVVLVCEHASNFIPEEFDNLGLDPAARTSHVAWDPGALGVAENLSRLLDAPLVASKISRLVYDCNRPPTAADAMPERSELFDIPGNRALDERERARRVRTYYEPFRTLLAERLRLEPRPRALVTVHSFTPVYMRRSREVELGILHDTDSRLADEMLRLAPDYCSMKARRNEPYGPEDGVTHTLKEHAIPAGIPNVMLEIRNDLISDAESQALVAKRLSALITRAFANMDDLAPGENRP